MRPNLALDIAVFQSFDSVHACFSEPAPNRPRPKFLGLRLVPHVIQLLFLGAPNGGEILTSVLPSVLPHGARIGAGVPGAPRGTPAPRLRCDHL